jgi:hypothetical protein
MSFRVTALWRSLGLAVVLALGARPLDAQVPNSPIVFAQSAITTSFVTPTAVGSGSGGGDSDAQWLKVEFHYSVLQPPLAPVAPGMTPPKFLDSVQFKIWIEGRDLYAPPPTTPQGIAVGLTGSVTYVNLPAARDAYGVFFVPPATLARYSTQEGGYEDFDRKFDVHVEAYVNGNLVDRFDKNKETDANWYQQLKPLAGFVYRQDQSPFVLTDINRYPPIKQPTPEQ